MLGVAGKDGKGRGELELIGGDKSFSARLK
jgi:hypothetical protein